MPSPNRHFTGLALTACAVLLTSSTATAQQGADNVSAPAASSAETPAGSLPAFEKAPVPIIDVALSDDGAVTGRVLTGDGKPVDGAQVVIRQDEKLLHKLITDERGQFSAKELRAGVYTIATVQGGGLYRLWPKNIAPPSARTQALVVTEQPVMRGQFGGAGLVNWATLGVGIAGLTVGIIALDKIDDVEDDVKALKSP